jgi:hypothetical protein
MTVIEIWTPVQGQFTELNRRPQIDKIGYIEMAVPSGNWRTNWQ